MAKIQRKFLILDIILVNIAMALAFLIRYDGRLPARYTDHLIPITFVVTLVSIGILFIFRIYNRLWQYASMEEFFSLGIGCMISTLFVKLVLSFFGPWVHLSVLAIFGMLQIGLIALSRVLMRIYYTRNRMQGDLNSSKVRRVMVVGAGDAGAMVIKELKRHPELNLKPVAVIDDNVDKHHSKIMGVPIVGSRSKIEETTRKLNIDEIIVAIPSASKALLKDILNECKKTKCKLKTLPGMYELIDGKVTI
jgi:FlaA1/EpsC-like NDP-sugar epimerase